MDRELLRKITHRDRARALRRNFTEAEAALWELLRDRRLRGFKFRRQHPWHSFILDFYCLRARLAIEVDGEGHTEPDQAERDMERTAELQAHGIRVLRFWNQQILNQPGVVLGEILDVLRRK